MSRMTLTKLAELAGVSASTVSHVLNGNPHTRVSEETRRRIFRVARETNYRPNLAARSLRRGYSGIIACVLADITNSLATRLIVHMDSRLRSAGFHTIIGHSAFSNDEELELTQRLIDRGVDAIVIGAIGQAPGKPDPLSSLPQQGTRLLRIDGPEGLEDFDYVTYDDCQGVRMAIDHMLELGHRRFAYVGPSDFVTHDRTRRRAFIERLAEAGITGEAAQVVERGPYREHGREAAMTLLDTPGPRPTAWVGFTDHVALGLLDGARSRGLVVGQDVSIVGFDNTDLVQDPAYSLNSIYLPEEPWAEAITEVLLGRLRGTTKDGDRQQRLLIPEYVARGSVGPVPSG
ncbi:MAG: LacI family DNA-binding transcriptional regulator [Planctomycetota bacterium]